MVRKHQVLVVDDDESVCDLVRAALELEGIEVSEAHHVIEAEREIAAHMPDAIVLDIGLPGIDGLFYCERLRENPVTRSLPVIVISGSAEASARAKAAGATAYLRKPLDPFELLSLLRRSLGIEPATPAGDTAGAQGIELERLFQIGQRQHEQLDQAHRRTLVALSAAIDSRDLGSAGHSDRVNAYGVRLALEVEPALIDDPSLEWGFQLHDVGMIGVPDADHAQADEARRRRAGSAAEPPGDRRAAPRRSAAARGRGAEGRPFASRAVGRHGISRPARRARHPCRGTDLRGRGRTRRDDRRPPLPEGDVLGGRAGRARAGRRQPVRPGCDPRPRGVRARPPRDLRGTAADPGEGGSR